MPAAGIGGIIFVFICSFYKRAKRTSPSDRPLRFAPKTRRISEKISREWQWRDGPEKVTIRGNLWFHQYEQVGGDAIDFVRRFYNKSYPEAMDFLLGGQLEAAPNSHSEFVRNNSYVPAFKTERKLFQLPEANDNNRRVEAYLIKTRKLDCDVSIPLSETG